MRTVVPGITIRLGDEPLDSETTVATAGPHVLTLSTAVPSLALAVTTTYTGADDVDTIAVDLVLARRPSASNTAREIPRDALPVTHARDRCLLDHLARVRDAVADHGAAEPAIDFNAAATTSIDDA